MGETTIGRLAGAEFVGTTIVMLGGPGLMVVAGVFAVYRLAVQYLPVYPEVRIPEPGFRVLTSPARERTASSRPQAAG